MIFKCIVVLLTLIPPNINAQLIEFTGGCPAVTPKQDFSRSKFAGKWYEVERTLAFYDIVGKCITWTFNEISNSYNVVQKTSNELTQAETINTISMTQNGAGTEGAFTANIRPTGFFFDIPVPYYIIETDYSSYAAVYSCVDLVFLRLRFVSILARNRFAFGEEFNNAYKALDANGIDRNGTFRVDQLLCSLFH